MTARQEYELLKAICEDIGSDLFGIQLLTYLQFRLVQAVEEDIAPFQNNSQ